MHNGANHFAALQHAARHIVGAGDQFAAGATAHAVVRYRGLPLANTPLDYWVIDAADTVIASGSGVTDASGVLPIALPGQYVGQAVNIVLNNLGADMSTAGRIRHQQVVTVT